MNVVITGGAGFIGSHVTDQLLTRGDKIWVIDNYATGRRDNLATHPTRALLKAQLQMRTWRIAHSRILSLRW
jgi:UDP-glucose 4-epimerase